jgi:glyoxylase-like metal-dependent hydrolase (beta-lactamase superfamily II)
MKPFALITALLATATSLPAQSKTADVVIKAVHAAKNVYMLEGSGGNIGVSAGPDGLLIVDDQFVPLAPRIEAALKELNPGPLKFVLNTHFHGDHTGGNAYFGQHAHIVAHENVRERMATTAGTNTAGLPVITFDQSLHFHFNGEEIRMHHVLNGHTDGDSFIHFTGANVVHLGDQFFSGRFPFIDLNAGGSIKGYIRNVADALETIPEDAKIIPGHGPLSTKKELREFHEMLVATSAIVEKAIADGKTLEQVKTAGLPEKWKSWDWPSISTAQWLDILYRGSGKPVGK